MKRRALVVPMTLALALAGCSDDAVGNADSETGEPADAGSETAGDGDGDDDDGEPADFGPVRGDLQITRVELSQALVQPVYEAGVSVTPAQYAVPLLNNRYTIVRALWATPEGWTPRPLIARLHVQQSDGSESVFMDYRTSQGTPTVVDSSSTEGDLLSSFFWRLDPEHVVPGMRYQVSVWEAEDAGSIPESSASNEHPASGFAAIAIEPEPAEIRVALIGVNYNVEGCVSNTSELPEHEFEALRAGFEAWNGVQTNAVVISTGINVHIDYPVASVTNLLGIVGQVRGQYAESFPDAFFYLLWDDCSAFPQGILGIAPLNNDPPEIDDAATRYAAGLWNPQHIRESVNTAVHEIGHNQGAPHAPCGVGSSDPNYPHVGASIGLWGLDPLDGKSYSPSEHTDFMSYCRPYWVSDYRWKKSFNHQKIMTSWSAGNASALGSDAPVMQGYSGAVLVGLIHGDAPAEWWINTRPTPPKVELGGELQVELELGGAPIAVASRVKDLPDLPGAKIVEIPLVHGVDADTITGIRVRGPAVERVQASPAIHDYRALKITGQPTFTKHTGG